MSDNNTLVSGAPSGHPLNTAQVAQLTQSFSEERANRVARNAVTSADVQQAARSVTAMRTYHDTFGVTRPKTGDVTNQRQSGRCWMFAAFNVARGHDEAPRRGLLRVLAGLRLLLRQAREVQRGPGVRP